MKIQFVVSGLYVSYDDKIDVSFEAKSDGPIEGRITMTVPSEAVSEYRLGDIFDADFVYSGLSDLKPSKKSSTKKKK